MMPDPRDNPPLPFRLADRLQQMKRARDAATGDVNHRARRIEAGIGALVCGLICLPINIAWLYTGDVQGPSGSFIMRGEWTGFWITTIIEVVAIIGGCTLILWG